MEGKGTSNTKITATCPSIQKVRDAIRNKLSNAPLGPDEDFFDELSSSSSDNDRLVDKSPGLHFYLSNFRSGTKRSDLSDTTYDEDTPINFWGIRYNPFTYSKGTDFYCLYNFTRKDNNTIGSFQVRIRLNESKEDNYELPNEEDISCYADFPTFTGYTSKAVLPAARGRGENIEYKASSPEDLVMSWNMIKKPDYMTRFDLQDKWKKFISNYGQQKYRQQEIKELEPEEIEKAFSVLGLPNTASWEEVEKAYKKLALKNHPDKGGDEEEFKKISGAHDVLKKHFGQ